MLLIWRRTIVICVLAVTCLLVGLWVSSSSNLNHVLRIKVAVHTTINGSPASADWTLPAIKHWTVEMYGPLRTTRSPFDTVYLRLPGGQGLGIDLRRIGFHTTWGGHTETSPQNRERAMYHILDSLNEPKVLTSYAMPGQTGLGCPDVQPVRDCKISTEMSLLAEGPIDGSRLLGGGDLLDRGGADRYAELRQFSLKPSAPMLFISMSATYFHSPNFQSDPLLGPIMRAVDRPTVVGVSIPEWRRVWELGDSKIRGDLTHLGGNAWRLGEPFTGTPDILDRPVTYYRTSAISIEDARTNPFLDMGRHHLVTGTVEYRGKLITYDPSYDTKRVMSLALIDPERDAVFLLLGPHVQAIWTNVPGQPNY